MDTPTSPKTNTPISPEIRYINCQHQTGPTERRPECPICQEDIAADEEVTVHTLCENAWHKSCIDQWIATSRPRGATCPMCRNPIAAPAPDRVIPYIPPELRLIPLEEIRRQNQTLRALQRDLAAHEHDQDSLAPHDDLESRLVLLHNSAELERAVGAASLTQNPGLLWSHMVSQFNAPGPLLQGSSPLPETIQASIRELRAEGNREWRVYQFPGNASILVVAGDLAQPPFNPPDDSRFLRYINNPREMVLVWSQNQIDFVTSYAHSQTVRWEEAGHENLRWYEDDFSRWIRRRQYGSDWAVYRVRYTPFVYLIPVTSWFRQPSRIQPAVRVQQTDSQGNQQPPLVPVEARDGPPPSRLRRGLTTVVDVLRPLV